DRQTAETVERWTDSKSSKKAEADSCKFVILDNCASDRVSGGRRKESVSQSPMTGYFSSIT
ncbi:MAG: hypothetical protein SPL66_06040, partial [Lachnospiraceae bacterium]|nr:hypothetical protein [Lachnospiraceae bacterium]